MRAVARALAFTALVASVHTASRAEPGAWVTVRAPDACEAASAIGSRAEERLVADLQDVRAHVIIEPRGSAYRVTIEATRDSESLGTKVLDASTCEEAADATVVVLTLALSVAGADRPNPASGDDAVQAYAVPMPPAKRVVSRPLASSLPRSSATDRGTGADLARRDESTLRASLATGVDAGTLPMATVQAAAGIAAVLDQVELRAIGRYGLPNEREEVDTSRSEQHRHHFGAVALDACYALGTAWRVAGCAGSEVALVFAEHRVQGETGLSVDDSISPRLAGVFSALLAGRAGSLQPEVELSSAVLVAGREEGTGKVALRAAVGVAMPF